MRQTILNELGNECACSRNKKSKTQRMLPESGAGGAKCRFDGTQDR